MKQVYYYRCPECHHIIEKEQLFDKGCPICGWTSPLKNTGKQIPVPSPPKKLGFKLNKKKFEKKGPLLDVFDEKDRLWIITELQGVEEKDINVTLNNKILTISAETPNHNYYREVPLPCQAEGRVIKSYKNGVLKITVRKKRELMW